MKSRNSVLLFVNICVVLVLFFLTAGSPAADENDSILNNHQTVSVIGSTVPANGDINPYGVAKVTSTVGNLQEGHVLVSNFNNSANLQGTGTTIVDISPNGALSVFAQIDATKLPGPCPGGVGLTTALVFLRDGWVVVGSLPTSDGTSSTAQAGCLIVLDSSGNAVETFSGSLINGPWDMAVHEQGGKAILFVTNVLNGTVAANGNVVNEGTVVRINLGVSASQMPWIESATVIGSGFEERTDPAALVIGPTGVGLSPLCKGGDACTTEATAVLYVSDTLKNRIAAIPDALTRTNTAGTGMTLSTRGSLNSPLGLTVAQDGEILVVNGGDGYITEITPSGTQVTKTLLDDTGTPPGSGALFGLIFDPLQGIIFVDDVSNTLNKLH
jgi:hypothetical protein